MKKINNILFLMMMVVPNILLAKTPPVDNASVLGDGIKVVAETGSLIGTMIVIGVVAIWMMPIAFGVLVYTGQKKKAEQQHEEVGLKAAVISLLAVVIGAAMSFYIVGTIGSLAANDATADLGKGNNYFLYPIIGKGLDNI